MNGMLLFALGNVISAILNLSVTFYVLVAGCPDWLTPKRGVVMLIDAYICIQAIIFLTA